ncbi:hypothetical protein Ferp_0008 [Ferroglobus placidus DSM 10642]|uniref:Uncharacterized protein n=1 Tax=Ferroglobus placidus (strain DSM 10642 / AEDII12DO) TaxID=589924 RepID=D3S0I6_FERPA|nr:hypothetical protein [Ferroglobus placidus]ADC64200.1 hypothetical protein Ferp_0008 [Ferroglobus placidus DSM 10642]
MKKFLTILFASLFIIVPSSAQVTVKEVKVGLDRIFVGDEVDCSIVLENKNSFAEKISSIVFYSDLVEPRIITDIGVIPPLSTYELPFTFKAEKPGKFSVEVKVSTPNGSTTYYVPFVVEKEMPEVVLQNTTIYLNEVNLLKVSVNADFDVYIKPLFNATPEVAYGREAVFKYYPKEREKIAFKIYFYNGRNYHEYVKEFKVEWKESRGVYFEVRAPEKVMVYDAVKVDIFVTNLKREAVYNIRLKALDRVFSYPVLLPSQSKNFSMYVTAFKPGVFTFNVELSYENEEIKRETKSIEVKVLNESAVDVCSYEFSEDVLRGEICNRGASEISSVVVFFGEEKAFVGSVAAGDFEIFEIKAKNTTGTLKLQWRNAAGDLLELEKEVKLEKVKVEERRASPLPIIVSVVAALVIISLALIALRRR